MIVTTINIKAKNKSELMKALTDIKKELKATDDDGSMFAMHNQISFRKNEVGYCYLIDSNKGERNG